MGIFSSCAQQAELEDLLKWIEAHKDYDEQANPIVFYDELVAEIKAKITAAEYD